MNHRIADTARTTAFFLTTLTAALVAVGLHL